MSNENTTPENDASQTPEAAPEAAEPAIVRATCACGCGIPTGKRSDWRQGHDQRAKGWLQRAISGKLFEGERAQVEALLARQEAKRALGSAAFAPLVAKAKKALAGKKAA